MGLRNKLFLIIAVNWWFGIILLRLNSQSLYSLKDTLEIEKINLNPVDHIYGKFKPDTTKGFVLIDSQYSHRPIYIIEEVYNSFLSMAQSAKEDSISLKIISGTRSFDDQRVLWENKWNGITKVKGVKLNHTYKNTLQRAKKILEYTAPPGFSRHHWGTDIDINSVETEYFETDEGIKVYSWLQKNASRFGFCQTYTSRELRNNIGFNEEKWHWSYMKIAEIMLQEVINFYAPKSISNFDGYKDVRKINLLEDYILSINNCK